jgi:hypothetical protein
MHSFEQVSISIIRITENKTKCDSLSKESRLSSIMPFKSCLNLYRS